MTMDQTNSERTASVATISLLEHDLEIREHVRLERWLAAALAVMVAVSVALVVTC